MKIYALTRAYAGMAKVMYACSKREFAYSSRIEGLGTRLVFEVLSAWGLATKLAGETKAPPRPLDIYMHIMRRASHYNCTKSKTLAFSTSVAVSLAFNFSDKMVNFCCYVEKIRGNAREPGEVMCACLKRSSHIRGTRWGLATRHKTKTTGSYVVWRG